MFPIPWNFPFRKKDGSLGKINDLSTSYTLPTASSETKGGIKVGTGATMAGETMNIDAQLPAYTSAEAGKVLKVADDGTLEWDDGGGSGGVVVLSGSQVPSSLVGENGNIYLLYNPTGVLRTNGIAIDLVLTNYIYRTSDKLVYRYKNSHEQNYTWPALFTVGTIGQAIASVQYNRFNGRKAINVRHGGGYSGDDNYPTNAVDDLVNCFEITFDGSDVSMKSGAAFGTYDTSIFSATLGTASDTDTDNLTLLPSNNNNPGFFDFHELMVYRNNELIHDYKPIPGAIKDFVDNTIFNISISGITILESGEIINAYFKKNGAWQTLVGTNISDIN